MIGAAEVSGVCEERVSGVPLLDACICGVNNPCDTPIPVRVRGVDSSRLVPLAPLGNGITGRVCECVDEDGGIGMGIGWNTPPPLPSPSPSFVSSLLRLLLVLSMAGYVRQ